MNPFALSGPWFLLLYVPMLLAGFALLVAVFRLLGPTPQLTGLLSDPYRLAMVSGGRSLATMAALASLAHRGAVRVAANRLWRVESMQAPNHPLERALLEAADGDLGIEGRYVADYRAVETWANGAEQALVSRGLLYGKTFTPLQSWSIGLVALPLLAFGVVRLLAALAGGQSNVGFLVGAMLLFALSLAALPFLRGNRPPGAGPAVGTARDLFQGLRDKVRHHAHVLESDDVAYAVALFGRYEIGKDASPQAFAALALAFPPEPRLTAAKIAEIASTSCGSTCGSLGGSSDGGSSCGGGCGGGCGGCGG